MKQKTPKTTKHKLTAVARTEKPSCGTLDHIAECRGAMHKNGILRWNDPPDSMNRIIRK